MGFPVFSFSFFPLSKYLHSKGPLDPRLSYDSVVELEAIPLT